MKITELKSAKRIIEWTERGENHLLDESQMGQFIKELIPYLKDKEFEISQLKQRIDYLENQNKYLNGLVP